MLSALCRIGFHAWPRVHGSWREAVVAPAHSQCRRCSKPLYSVWRRVYPEDGSRCRPGSCHIHIDASSQGRVSQVEGSQMKMMFSWLVGWPWVGAVLLVVAITELTIVPWYLSAWLAIGLAMMAMVIVRRLRVRMQQAEIESQRSTRALRLGRSQGEVPPAAGAAPPVL